MRRRALIVTGCLLAVVLALVAAGCGGETVSPAPETVVGTVPTETQAKGDPEAGKTVFASAGCGSCHTLADAGGTGTVGPNLDQSKPDLALVTDRVKNGKGTMPPFSGSLSPQQIADVAAYVVGATKG